MSVIAAQIATDLAPFKAAPVSNITFFGPVPKLAMRTRIVAGGDRNNEKARTPIYPTDAGPMAYNIPVLPDCIR